MLIDNATLVIFMGFRLLNFDVYYKLNIDKADKQVKN